MSRRGDSSRHPFRQHTGAGYAGSVRSGRPRCEHRRTEHHKVQAPLRDAEHDRHDGDDCQTTSIFWTAWRVTPISLAMSACE